MEITIERPPRTIMEVYEMLPEGTLAELIENQIYMSPAPLFEHHRLTKLISKQLDKIIEDTNRGTVVFAPFDVKLDETNSVQPDIFVVLKSNVNQITKSRFNGAPDLIVEILSPGNRNYDMIKKKDLYEKFGVKEYWILDPDTKLALGFQWIEARYHKIGEEIGQIKSPLVATDFKF
jgi:Uma2 family endonuclease